MASFRSCLPLMVIVNIIFMFMAVPAVTQDAVDPREDSISGATPYDDTIDKFSRKVTSKIFNGNKAADGAYPWQVALIVSLIDDPIHGFFCSGSIYSETWIITAAHCLVRQESRTYPRGKLIVLTPEQLFVVYGTNVLKSGVLRAKVAKILLHDAFNKQTFDNDIALVKLATPLTLSQKATPIPVVSPVDEPKKLKERAPLTVTGWGSTSAAAEHAGLPVRQLQDGLVEFVPSDKCKLAISGSTITANMMCAYSRDVDVCTGDSGGPIIPYPTTADATLLGVISGNWVGDCGNMVYKRHTRVARFETWIKNCSAAPDSCPLWKP
jgi:secreted trypsin-like serine protease